MELHTPPEESVNSSPSSQQDATSVTATTIPETTVTETTENIETINAQHPHQIDHASKATLSLRSSKSPLNSSAALNPIHNYQNSTKPIWKSLQNNTIQNHLKIPLCNILYRIYFLKNI